MFSFINVYKYCTCSDLCTLGIFYHYKRCLQNKRKQTCRDPERETEKERLVCISVMINTLNKNMSKTKHFRYLNKICFP